MVVMVTNIQGFTEEIIEDKKNLFETEEKYFIGYNNFVGYFLWCICIMMVEMLLYGKQQQYLKFIFGCSQK